MSQQFLLPDLGEGLTEAAIVSWLVAPGDIIVVDQPVVEVESAKSIVELPSPYAGRVERLDVAPGQTVAKGTVLLSIVELDGAEISTAYGGTSWSSANAASGSGASGHDASGSGASGSDTSGSDASRSGTSGSGASGSGASRSDASRSDTSGHDASRSDTSGSGASGSDTSGHDASGSGTSGHAASRSDASRHAASRSDASRHDASRSDASSSGAVLVGYGTTESTMRIVRPEGGRFGRGSSAAIPADSRSAVTPADISLSAARAAHTAASATARGTATGATSPSSATATGTAATPPSSAAASAATAAAAAGATSPSSATATATATSSPSAAGAAATPPSSATAAAASSAECGSGDLLLDPARRSPVVSPLVRARARANGFDASELRGSRAGSLVCRDDVEAAITTRAAASAGQRDVASPAATSASAAASSPTDLHVPLVGLRKLIASRLSESRRIVPDVTLWLDVDVSDLLKAKERLLAVTGEKFSLTTLIARFVVAGLRKYPILNSSVVSLPGGGDEILQHGAINLGIAAQTPRGLMVPVVHGAESLTTRQLRDAISALVTASTEGNFVPAALSGGTFTLNNYGAFGVDGSTPIVNYPEVAMLGIGRIRERAWVVNHELAVRDVMVLTFVFDHRVCDGDVASGFLTFVAGCIEEPLLLLGEI